MDEKARLIMPGSVLYFMDGLSELLILVSVLAEVLLLLQIPAIQMDMQCL